jgi:hypothetical protein
VPFPLFPDENPAIAQGVGVMKTPVMVPATHSGKVLTSHSGVIRDFDGLPKDAVETHKKQ